MFMLYRVNVSSVAMLMILQHLAQFLNVCQKIESTRLVSFDIKFTRQGFENAC